MELVRILSNNWIYSKRLLFSCSLTLEPTNYLIRERGIFAWVGAQSMIGEPIGWTNDLSYLIKFPTGIGSFPCIFFKNYGLSSSLVSMSIILTFMNFKGLVFVMLRIKQPLVLTHWKDFLLLGIYPRPPHTINLISDIEFKPLVLQSHRIHSLIWFSVFVVAFH